MSLFSFTPEKALSCFPLSSFSRHTKQGLNETKEPSLQATLEQNEGNNHLYMILQN